MKMKPYEELLKMSKEAIDASLAKVRVKAAKKKAKLEIARLDERIATLESVIDILCCEQDIDFDRIIQKQDDLALVERRMKQFEKIVAEMFPEKK